MHSGNLLNLIAESQNPDIPLAGRVGAAHGGAAGRGPAGQDGAPTDRFAQETTPQGVARNCPERLFRRTNKRNPMKTYGGSKAAVDKRFIRWKTSALRSWLVANGPSLFFVVLIFVFHARHIREKPVYSTGRPGRGEAGRGGPGEHGGTVWQQVCAPRR